MLVRRPVILAACMAALTAALAGCSDPSEQAAAATAPDAAAPALAPGQVRVQPASLKFIDIREIGTSGYTNTFWVPARVAFLQDRVAEVVAPVSGRVTELRAQVGDTVQSGTPLAAIASPEASRIRADYSNAQIELKVAQAEADRQRMMVEKGVGVEAEMQVAQARLQQARHNAEVAARASGYLGQGGSDTLLLRAPRAGVVVARNVMPGASVGAESGPLFTIGDPSALWITADVFENDIVSVHEGASVQVVIPSLDQPLGGKVARVGSMLDAQTRRAQVFISLDKPNPALRAGMLARAGIQARSPDGLSVPMGAVLIKDGDRSIVFVQVSDTVFEARTVHLGPPSNGLIPVLSGLSPGEKVVVKGGLLLDGSATQLL